MNKDMKESANIKPRPSKQSFLHYCKELWNNNSHQENYWNAENVDNELKTMEELKEALRKTMENYLVKVT
jgi:hypothetical protein